MTAHVQPGTVLADKYRVERILGEGGMGVVVAATHLHLEQLVALKFMLPEAAANAESVQRFLREARAAVRLKSEHVARVLDVGTLEGGMPYIVMEYLEGADLAAVTFEKGALPVGEAVEYLLQTCEAIAEAHSVGIVHRDLKPANLFLTHRPDHTPSIKVLDFGISKVQSHAITHTTTLMGSPNYMSPEQMASAKDVDGRSDIWSLGVILYQLLTGRAPFDAETIPQLCVKIMNQPYQPLRELRSELPGPLENIIARCLAKDRAHRFANVADLASALAPFAPRRALTSIERVRALGSPTSPTPLVPVVTATRVAEQDTAVATAVSWGQTRGEPRMAAWKIAVLAAGGLTLVAGAFFVVRAATSDAPPHDVAVAPARSETTPSVEPTASTETAPSVRPVEPAATAPSPSESAAPSASSPKATAAAAPVAKPPRPGTKPPPARPASAGDDDVFKNRH